MINPFCIFCLTVNAGNVKGVYITFVPIQSITIVNCGNIIPWYWKWWKLVAWMSCILILLLKNKGDDYSRTSFNNYSCPTVLWVILPMTFLRSESSCQPGFNPVMVIIRLWCSCWEMGCFEVNGRFWCDLWGLKGAKLLLMVNTCS